MSEPRKLWVAALQIAGLWSIAVAHPLLDVLGRAPVFFVAHRAGPSDVLILLAALLFVPPLVLTGAVAAVGARHSGGRALAMAIVLTTLVGLVAKTARKARGVVTAGLAIPLAMLAGAATAALYFRFAGWRSFFTLLAAGLLVVPLVFVLRPGVSRLILSSRQSLGVADPAAIGFRPHPIVLVVFDELPLLALLDRDGGIDPVVYPNLSALARDGIWFRNATTVSDYTELALPALVTGRYPARGELPSYRHHPDTLFSFLSGTHRLRVSEKGGTDLMPRREPVDSLRARVARIGADLVVVAASVLLTPDLYDRFGLPDMTTRWAGFGLADGAEGGPWPNPPDWRERRQSATAFIEAIRASDEQPAFYYLHTLLPHHPWVFLPTGQRNGSMADFPAFSRLTSPDDEWAIVQIQQRHLLQVAFVDRLVGELVARLQHAGLYKRSLVIVTADHGIAFTRGHHQRQISPETATEIMRIPLIVKLPDGESHRTPAFKDGPHGQQVSDRNVQSVDIAPSIADALGLSLPWPADGVSFLDRTTSGGANKRLVPAFGTTTHRFAADGPAIDAALRRRIERFGDRNTYHVPRPPRYEALVGRRVADLPATQSAVRTELALASRYERFEPAAATVPLELNGRLVGGDNLAGPFYVAVSVNGTIQAVTRTWPSGSGRWFATPPLSAWRRGRNAVDIFLLEGTDEQPLLRSVSRETSRPADLNLISEAAALYWNVDQRGFSSHERNGDRRFRWTLGDASVTVPLAEDRPAAVRVVIARASTRGTRLEVTANGCALYTGTVPHREWDVTFSLAPCELMGDTLTIGIKSDTTQPPGGQDRRSLGVAVREVVLQMTE